MKNLGSIALSLIEHKTRQMSQWLSMAQSAHTNTFLLLRCAPESRSHEQRKPHLRFNYCGACHLVDILTFLALTFPPCLSIFLSIANLLLVNACRRTMRLRLVFAFLASIPHLRLSTFGRGSIPLHHADRLLVELTLCSS
jgi:hypothetical protein